MTTSINLQSPAKYLKDSKPHKVILTFLEGDTQTFPFYDFQAALQFFNRQRIRPCVAKAEFHDGELTRSKS